MPIPPARQAPPAAFVRAVAPLALVTLALAGCLDAGPVDPAARKDAAWEPPAPATAADPLGDAVEAPLLLAPLCWTFGCEGTPLRAAAAPVAFPDVGDVALAVDPDALVITIGLGVASADLAELRRGDGLHRIVELETCLEIGDVPGCVYSSLMPGEGEAAIESWWMHLDEACNEWQACVATVPSTFTPGDAATLTLRVPLAALPIAAEGSTAGSVAIGAYLRTFEPTLPGTHAAYTMYMPGEHQHQHAGPFSFRDLIDDLAATPIALALPAGAAWPEGDGSLVLRSAPGANWGAGSAQDHPRYDLREIRFEETPDALLVRIVTGGWEGDPLESALIVAVFGSDASTVYEAGLLREGGETYGYIGHCITYPCTGAFVRSDVGHDHGGWQARLPYDTPEGVIEIAVPWEHVPDLQAGERINFVLGITMYADVAVFAGEYGDAVHGDLHKMSLMDTVFGAEPYVIQIGAPEGAGDHTH